MHKFKATAKLGALLGSQEVSMLRNGKTVCNACNLLIDTPYQKYVRIQRPETAGDNPNDFVHVHNRDANDCWSRVRKTAQIHAASKQRTQPTLLPMRNGKPNSKPNER
jgi:hypothetical protein